MSHKSFYVHASLARSNAHVNSFCKREISILNYQFKKKMSQLRLYDWKRIGVYSDHALETYVRNNSYRTVKRNGKQKQQCNECSPNIDMHLMEFWYRHCTSVKCHESNLDKCPFK